MSCTGQYSAVHPKTYGWLVVNMLAATQSIILDVFALAPVLLSYREGVYCDRSARVTNNNILHS